MIILNSALVPGKTNSDLTHYKVVIGRVYDEVKREFLDFTANLSPAEVGMLYKGDILLNEIVDNCLVGKDGHSIYKTKSEDIDTLMKEDYIKERLKPYLREDRLGELGI
jgi:hypothetical protein